MSDKPYRESWYALTGKKRPAFPKKLIQVFQRYVRTCDLPLRDRVLLAAMVAQIVPDLNENFDRARFLRGCGIEPSDAKPIIDALQREAASGSK